MQATYLPILLFVIVAVGLASLMVVLPFFLARLRGYDEKNSPYECGFEGVEKNRGIFDVRFYLVAILFIIFDLEIALMFPWAVALREVGVVGFVSMLCFLAMLGVGFIYEWRKGALDWE